MDRQGKIEAGKALGEVFDGAGSVIIAHFTGLTVAEMTQLRVKLREGDATLQVIKNRVAVKALEGKDAEGASGLFKGPCVIAYADDPVAPAKAMRDFAKTNDKLVLVGGFMGSSILDEKGVTALAAMPSREEVIASIVSCIGAPAANIAGAIGAPASNIASILSTLEERDAA